MAAPTWNEPEKDLLQFPMQLKVYPMRTIGEEAAQLQLLYKDMIASLPNVPADTQVGDRYLRAVKTLQSTVENTRTTPGGEFVSKGDVVVTQMRIFLNEEFGFELKTGARNDRPLSGTYLQTALIWRVGSPVFLLMFKDETRTGEWAIFTGESLTAQQKAALESKSQSWTVIHGTELSASSWLYLNSTSRAPPLYLPFTDTIAYNPRRNVEQELLAFIEKTDPFVVDDRRVAIVYLQRANVDRVDFAYFSTKPQLADDSNRFWSELAQYPVNRSIELEIPVSLIKAESTTTAAASTTSATSSERTGSYVPPSLAAVGVTTPVPTPTTPGGTNTGAAIARRLRGAVAVVGSGLAAGAVAGYRQFQNLVDTILQEEKGVSIAVSGRGGRGGETKEQKHIQWTPEHVRRINDATTDEINRLNQKTGEKIVTVEIVRNTILKELLAIRALYNEQIPESIANHALISRILLASIQWWENELRVAGSSADRPSPQRPTIVPTLELVLPTTPSSPFKSIDENLAEYLYEQNNRPINTVQQNLDRLRRFARQYNDTCPTSVSPIRFYIEESIVFFARQSRANIHVPFDNHLIVPLCPIQLKGNSDVVVIGPNNPPAMDLFADGGTTVPGVARTDFPSGFNKHDTTVLKAVNQMNYLSLRPRTLQQIQSRINVLRLFSTHTIEPMTLYSQDLMKIVYATMDHWGKQLQIKFKDPIKRILFPCEIELREPVEFLDTYAQPPSLIVFRSVNGIEKYCNTLIPNLLKIMNRGERVFFQRNGIDIVPALQSIKDKYMSNNPTDYTRELQVLDTYLTYLAAGSSSSTTSTTTTVTPSAISSNSTKMITSPGIGVSSSVSTASPIINPTATITTTTMFGSPMNRATTTTGGGATDPTRILPILLIGKQAAYDMESDTKKDGDEKNDVELPIAKPHTRYVRIMEMNDDGATVQLFSKYNVNLKSTIKVAWVPYHQLDPTSIENYHEWSENQTDQSTHLRPWSPVKKGTIIYKVQ